MNQVKDTIDSEIGIMDQNGLILACSNEERVGQINPLIDEVMEANDIFMVIRGQSFQKVYIKNKMEYIAFISSDDSNNSKYLRLICLNIVNIKAYYDEKYDKINFIKSVVLDNILPGDITLRAKELHITNNVYRVAFLIKTEPAKDI
jgi:carbohydrate diacid regulator